jgi:hypothetical protein
MDAVYTVSADNIQLIAKSYIIDIVKQLTDTNQNVIDDRLLIRNLRCISTWQK